MRWLWELIDSTTVDDFSCKTCVRKLQSTIGAGKFLSLRFERASLSEQGAGQ